MDPKTGHIYTPEEVDAMSEEEKQALIIGELSELQGMQRLLEHLRELPDATPSMMLPPKVVVANKKERRARSKQSRRAARKNRG